MESANRTAVWYYLHALANFGMNYTALALTDIEKAIQMDPGNPTYRKVYEQAKMTGGDYAFRAENFGRNDAMCDCDNGFCLSLCLLRICCPFDGGLCC